ncbi:hypothetical protein [Halorubrum distributum]|uniref:hypothetical protein n=1 Tax=Halorubrum distributum TaxID=29283 RepID=UPI0012671FC9|nr:hypothetical protein [Halorubrum distributum]
MPTREPKGDRVGSTDPGTIPDDVCPPRLREEHPNRERGILTKKDRELLIDSSNGQDSDEQSDDEQDSPNAQTIRNRRYQIRKRVVNSIKDFEVLSRCWEDRDRKRVFETLSKEDSSYLKEVGIFLYLGFQDLGAGKKRFLKEVIEEAEHRRGRDVRVTVSSTLDNGLSYQIEIDETSSSPTKAD